jgi:hypothetical protein
MKSAQRATTYCRRFIFEGYSVYFFGSIQLYGFTKAMIQNLEFIADKEALKKIADKSLSANPFKITTKKIVWLSLIILSIINQKKIIMLNKINQKKSILGNMLWCFLP